MKIFAAICFLFVFTNSYIWAQDAHIQAEKPAMDYYYSSSPDAEELAQMKKAVLQEVTELYAQLSETSKDKMSDMQKLLQRAQLLALLYVSDMSSEDLGIIAVIDSVEELLGKTKDLALDYLESAPRQIDTQAIQIELAMLASLGMPFFAETDFYQALSISKYYAARSYLKEANAKSALVLGVWYMGSIQGKQHSLNQDFARKYLERALELDQGQSFVSYLAYVYLANLSFKTHNVDKMKEYLVRADDYYPKGYFTVIIDEFYFKQGKVLF